MSPLEDTIVALRPAIPVVPFELPNSIRMLNPMMPEGDTGMFNNIDEHGNPTHPSINQLVNLPRLHVPLPYSSHEKWT